MASSCVPLEFEVGGPGNWSLWPGEFLEFPTLGTSIISRHTVKRTQPMVGILGGIEVGVMICNLTWATGDYWSVARLGVPGDIYSWWAGEVSVFFFLFLVFLFLFFNYAQY